MTLYLVTGPPASGKSTWVREHARHGDVTIDYDALAGTLTPPGKQHAWPAHIKAITKAARQAAIDTAIRHAANVNVYVIHSSPSPTLVNHYREHGAEIIVIDPGQDVVMARAKRERPWQMQQAIKEWYADPQIQQTSTMGQQTAPDTSRDW